MKKYFCVLAFLPMLLFSQVYEDFTDAELLHNPAWSGTLEKFRINDNLQLQLDDSQEGNAWITTKLDWQETLEWQIWCRLAFSPSSGNNCRIYLSCDQEDLSMPLNGYFLQLGETGGSDAIQLFRQEGELLTPVCRGTDGFISSAFAISIRVIKNSNGTWQLFADPNGGMAFQIQAEGIDAVVNEAGYMGLHCDYTKSNAANFYFDNLYAGPIIVDENPPSLEMANPLSDTTLMLLFSEPLDENSVYNYTNYLVSGGIGNPEDVELFPDLSRILLNFEEQFKNGQTYRLAVSGLKDLSGNLMDPQELQFVYFQPQPFDIVFNEIMADPSPPVNLPEYEYLELLNRTEFPVDLNGWFLIIGSREIMLENISISPGGYLLLSHQEAAPEFEQFVACYGLPGFSLPNGGQELLLKDLNDVVIARVNYQEDWYNHPEKSQGGWSLEKINPEDLCAKSANWTAAEHNSGGTPGAENSVLRTDFSNPGVTGIALQKYSRLNLYFSHYMDTLSLTDVENYFVDQGIGNPVSAIPVMQGPDEVELTFNADFQTGIVYQLTIGHELRNCSGQLFGRDTTLSFGVPVKAEMGDVLINEILFNPLSGGHDYVELYNNSEKIIDLSAMELGSVRDSPPNPRDTSFYAISKEQILLMPHTYLLLTKLPETVKKQYFTANPHAFLAMEPFPVYNNDMGACILASQTGELIDAMQYTEEMHFPLLNYVKGVSLERTGFGGSPEDPPEWHSAAASSGFGTPGYRNSQFMAINKMNDEITVYPEIFSPDNDGYNDMIGISYRFDQPGFLMTVKIFDSNGNLVKNLVNNQYLGTEGAVKWDGITNDNRKAAVGIYVFFIQIHDLKGKVRGFKKTGILAGKL